MKGRYRICACVLVAALALPAAAPAQTKKKDILFSKKLYSGITFGFSLWFFKEAYDARQDAGDAYDRYRATTSTQRVGEFYDESRRNDTKAAILLGLGLGTLAYSVHLFLSEDSEDLPPPKMRNGLVEVKGVSLDLAGDPLNRGVRLKLKKGF